MKKQQQKKYNPFKVNVTRNKKPKAKAQPFKGQLKNLKNIITKKVNLLDEESNKLAEVMRQPMKHSHKPVEHMDRDEPNTKPDSIASNHDLIEKYKQKEKNTEEALKKLEEWKC